jgi:hypothetical protein
MAANFVKEIETEGSEAERTVLTQICSLSSPEFDIEWLVSVLDVIAEPQASPLFPLVAAWKFDIANQNLRDTVKTLSRQIRANLLKWLQPRGDCAYLAPLSTFAYHISPPEHGPEHSRRHTMVFTLNYDLCVEIAFINKHIPYETGFEEMLGGCGRYGLWDQRLLDCYIGVTLYKLHGSLNWGTVKGLQELACEPVREFEGGGLISARMRRQDAGFVWGGLDPFGRMPGMVFAQPAKGIPYQPYLYLQASFDKALKYAAALVVIGYSWRDTYLNEKILSASVNGLNVINMGREARKIEGIRLSLGGGVLAALEGKRVFLEDGSAVEGGLRGAIIKHFPELTQHVNP